MHAIQGLLQLYQQYQQEVELHLTPWAKQKHRRQGERQLQYQRLQQYIAADIKLLQQLLVKQEELNQQQWDSLRTHYYHRDHPLEFMPEVEAVANVRSAIFRRLQVYSF